MTYRDGIEFYNENQKNKREKEPLKLRNTHSNLNLKKLNIGK